MSFTILSGTSYPTGSGGPFVLKIDGGTASEEKILCSALSGTTVTVATGGRGWDNTAAASHGSGQNNVEHCFTAAEADDANDHVYTTTRDDHVQYLRADGTRSGAAQTFTGAVTVNSGGVAVTGNSTFANNVTVSGNLNAGSSPAVCYLDGSHQYRLQAGSTGIVTNGSGQATITFPNAFGTIVAVMASATTGNGGFATTVVISQTASSFVVECLSTSGALMTSASLTVNWIAIGF